MRIYFGVLPCTKTRRIYTSSCGGQLDAVENVQMRAARIFLGVGRRHPLVSLQFEMDMLPVKWVALRRGIEFWVQVMRMNDDRLVKVVMLEAFEIGSKVK